MIYRDKPQRRKKDIWVERQTRGNKATTGTITGSSDNVSVGFSPNSSILAKCEHLM